MDEITEIEQLERELQEKKARLQNLVGCWKDFRIIVDSAREMK